MNQLPLKRAKIRIFNPHRLNPEELESSFIARHDLFRQIMAEVVDAAPQGAPQHHLIIGQRGMGKTTLLCRLALELHRPPYSATFLPLRFPEEQYIEVDRLSKFWLNCLDSMADSLEQEGQIDVARELDQAVNQLSQRKTDETTYQEECREVFTKAWQKLARRPVLLLDNFNLLLGKLRTEDFVLRGYFSSGSAPILIAASAVYPEELTDYGAAFYDGFKSYYLYPLTLDEVRDVLLRLAQLADRPGLVDRIHREAPRLAALRDLTGGNPRTAVLLFELFSDGFSEDAFEDLDALLDLITPLYQSRLEQLSELAQTIVGTLARNWSPMTKADIVHEARLNDSSVSPQLGRLRDIGLVEETSIFPGKKTGYQIAERFFNIWYLMRFSSRRQRASLQCLTRFLEEFHTPDERFRSARELLRRDRLTCGNITYAMALAGALAEQPALARELEWKAQLDLIQQMDGVRDRIAAILDPDDIHPNVFNFADLKRKLECLVPNDSPVDGQTFAKRVLSSLALVPTKRGKSSHHNRASVTAKALSSAEITSLLEEFDVETRELNERFSPDSVKWLQERLYAGTLTSWNDGQGLEALISLADDPLQLRIIRSFGDSDAKKQLSDLALDKIVERLELKPSDGADSGAWRDWGKDLEEFGRFERALDAFRKAVDTDPSVPLGWSGVGQMLEHLSRFSEAETAYREAVKVGPKSSLGWFLLGRLFEMHLSRVAEAESAYRNAIERDPEDFWNWHYLAVLLASHSSRFSEAEPALREAIRLSPTSVWSWCRLGMLYHKKLNRFEEAEIAFREAIRLDASNPWPQLYLGELLDNHFGRYAEAEQIYRNAIQSCEPMIWFWTELADLLSTRFGRQQEALDVLRAATLIAPSKEIAWAKLGDLLQSHFSDYQGAECAYRETIQISPDSMTTWDDLARLYDYYLEKPEQAVEAYRRVLDLKPSHDRARHYLSCLLRDVLGRPEEAESVLSKLGGTGNAEFIAPYERALNAAWTGDWTIPEQELRVLLPEIQNYQEFARHSVWHHLSAVLLHLGFGERFVKLLEDVELDIRALPWFSAVKAHCLGDRRYLLNLPVEARPAAEQIFDDIAKRRAQLAPVSAGRKNERS